MWKLGIVLLFGLALLPVVAAARGRAHSTVFHWSLAGLILWLTGLSLAMGDTDADFIGLAHAAGPVSASLFLVGARHLAHRPPLRWVLWLGASAGFATGLAFHGLSRPAAVAIDLVVSFPMLAASAWYVTRNAWRDRGLLAEKALGVAVATLAILMPADILVRMVVDADAILLPAWATVAFCIAFLLLATLAERAAARARRLTHALAQRSAELEVEHGSLGALIDSLPSGVVLADCDARIRYLSPRAASLLGVEPADEWPGRPAAALKEVLFARLDPAEREAFAAAFDGPLPEFDAGRAFDLSLDAGDRVLAVVDRLVPGSNGESLGRLWVFADVTEERQLAERLGHAERMETVGTLAGGIAHDFSNQLMAIFGNVELLLEDGGETDDRREAARQIQAAALHCAELTHGLLSFARRGPASPELLDVGSIVREVAELLEPGLAPGVTLAAQVADATGSIVADAGDFRRVLVNLGVNARDAVGEGGKIRIDARRLTGTSGDRIEITVSDDGVGMDESTCRRIFDPFFTTKAPEEGSGLGLSVVYGIAERHDAHIEVESAPGEGTTFRLLWPVGSTELVVPKSAAGAPDKDTSAACVLLVDDDEGVRRAVRRMLERAGHTVVEACDGPSAVAAVRERVSEIDLVVMDLAMPGFSGFDAREEVRQLDARLPVILMSGNPDRFHELAKTEDTDLLLKPFRSRELLERVAARLSSSG